MKRTSHLLLLAVLMLISIPVSAQLKFGIKGGLNISSVHFDKSVVSSDNLNGFYVGPTLEMVMPGIGFGVDASLLYTQKGFENELGKVKNDYLDIPVNLKCKIGAPVLKAYLSAGPYVGFRIGGENSIKEQFQTKSFAAGLNFGAGIELFKHLQAGINYGLGMTENYSSELSKVNGKDRGWSITATILF